MENLLKYLLCRYKMTDTESTSELEGEYIVEKILKKRICHGRIEYFLKWKGFKESENSWEPTENLNCPELIQAFEEEHAKSQMPKGSENIDRIVGAFKEGADIIFVMKWKGTDECTLMSSKIANFAYTQDVIKFYQDRISWK